MSTNVYEQLPLTPPVLEPEIESSPTLTTWKEKLRDLRYLTFLFVGIGLLWPWNCILSASLYFKTIIFKETTIWAKIFASSMMTTSTISSMLFNVWLARRQHSYSRRVVRGLVWEVIAFVLLTIISLIHNILPLWFSFINIMLLVSISSIATAMTQNGIMAIANVYGGEFSQSVVMGQAVAGVLPSVVLLFVAFVSPDNDGSSSSTGGILFYFLTTAIVSIICICLYKVSNVDQKLVLIAEGSPNLENKTEIPFNVLFKKLKWLVCSIFMTFMVTLIFPVFASTISVTRLPITNSQYIPLIFTVWNLGDLYGRVIADLPTFRDPNFTPLRIFIYSNLRIIMVPIFFYFAHYYKDTKSRTIFFDMGYILLQFIFGVTNGHVISISFMKVPETVDTEEEKEAAGGFTNIFVATGLAAGSILSYMVVFMI
ncbi:nucleoside transmembrane transporter FUN26 NDAI_0H02530 [Naumovozyma dairenensis CBS 421]|uniref:Nucleoside transporter FUN26 n=1 Tax=Naumovozyma dairenensis (strain ATCC 10597 / BCRC 20456 / CBS 421 / NBRC 0211 / NRRL Y-12639) TaxID=1071378 RepID=G0WF66_NAUDC|nr:hypothetical protein NDAI_0H02530 [Naumovozyma dairenensis CBS 421]CCD26427.1 hypothetical protein NDAI_0H02530 [Naumovozyma dairenensis CBS 421]